MAQVSSLTRQGFVQLILLHLIMNGETIVLALRFVTLKMNRRNAELIFNKPTLLLLVEGVNLTDNSKLLSVVSFCSR